MSAMSGQGNGSGSNGSNGAAGIFYNPSSLTEGIDLPAMEKKLDERSQLDAPSNGGYLPQLPAPGAQQQSASPPIIEQMPPAPGPATSTLPIGGQDPPRVPVVAREPQPTVVRAPVPQYGPRHTQAIGNWQEHEQAHMLGVSTVVVATSTIIGTRFGGLYGAVAGSLFGGAGLNAMRAIRYAMEGTTEGDREALVSGTYTVVAAGLGGYLTWMGIKAKRAKA
jgi:hypothetical protein